MRIILKAKGKSIDVTGFLFGYSSRVLIPHGLLPKEAVKQIVHQLEERSERVFGASLSVIREEDSIREGDIFLHLAPCSTSLRKYLIVITALVTKEVDWNKKSELAKTVSYQYIWPEWAEGSEGFVHIKNFTDLDGISGTYLKWDGPLPKDSPRPSFFGELDRLASDFFSLAECWALCCDTQLKDKRTLDNGSILASWEEGFTKKYRNTFLHRKIRYFLESVHRYGEIPRGINTIYDNRTWRFPTDLISPLLEQMQNDILEALLGNKILLETVLYTGSLCWQKKMKVIFDRYYGPIYIAPSAHQKDKSQTNVSYCQKRLELLERIILRPIAPAVSKMALNLWEQIAGRSYTPKINKI